MMDQLEAFCNATNKTKTDAIGEMILNYQSFAMQKEEFKRQVIDLHDFKQYILDLIEREAIKAYGNKMTEEEKKKWGSL